MLLNKLKLNGDKTELLVIHSRYRPSPVFSLNCGYDIITPSDMARNIGVIFDKNMTMIPQLNYSPVYTTLNFWYGTDKIGTRTTFLVLGLPI